MQGIVDQESCLEILTPLLHGIIFLNLLCNTNANFVINFSAY